MLLLHLTAAAQEPASAQAYTRQARELYEHLHYESALKILSSALASAPTEDELVSIYLLQGIIRADSGSEGEAATAFEKALHLRPGAALPLDVSPKISRLFEAVRAMRGGEAQAAPQQPTGDVRAKARAAPQQPQARPAPEAKAEPPLPSAAPDTSIKVNVSPEQGMKLNLAAGPLPAGGGAQPEPEQRTPEPALPAPTSSPRPQADAAQASAQGARGEGLEAPEAMRREAQPELQEIAPGEPLPAPSVATKPTPPPADTAPARPVATRQQRQEAPEPKPQGKPPSTPHPVPEVNTRTVPEVKIDVDVKPEQRMEVNILPGPMTLGPMLGGKVQREARQQKPDQVPQAPSEQKKSQEELALTPPAATGHASDPPQLQQGSTSQPALDRFRLLDPSLSLEATQLVTDVPISPLAPGKPSQSRMLLQRQPLQPGDAFGMHTYLAYYGLTRGFFHGLLVAGILHIEDNGPMAVALLSSAVGESLVGYLLPLRDGMTPGKAHVIGSGLDFGLIAGFGVDMITHGELLWKADDIGSRCVLPLALSLGGAIAGSIMVDAQGLTWGDMEFVHSSGLVGALVGSALLSGDNQKKGTGLLVGSAAGLFAGAIFVQERDFSVGQGLLLDLAAVLGGIGGGAVGGFTDDHGDPSLLLGLGSVVGMGVTYLLLIPFSQEQPQKPPMEVSLSLSPGGLAGRDTQTGRPAPTSLLVQGRF